MMRKAGMGVRPGAFLKGVTALVLVVASATLPIGRSQDAELQRRADARRTLMASPVSLDDMLAQAERLGSGEATFDQLTAQRNGAQVAVQPIVLSDPQPTLRGTTPVAGAQSTQRLPDPLAAFERSKQLAASTDSERESLEAATASTTAESSREASLLTSLKPSKEGMLPPVLEPQTGAVTQNLAPNGDVLMHREIMPPSGSLNDALAQFDHEQTATLGSATPAYLGSEVAKPSNPASVESPLHITPVASLDGGHQDLGESDDLGESASMDASMGVTESQLNAQIEKEAAVAAQSVLKDTMKNVENDFLMSERQLTKSVKVGGPKLTLDALRKPSAKAAQAKKERQQARDKAKQDFKKMNLEAKLAYDKAIGAAHKVAKEQLEHTLAGLKMQLSVKKKSLQEQANIQIQQAKQRMLDQIRTQETIAVNRLQANLPVKLAQVKKKAQAEAEHVASLAIQQITQENKKVRQSLQSQLGEANNKLQQAQTKLGASDENPAAALKRAVALKAEKNHVAKLGELANVALTQEKARAASQVARAQTDAKESVRLAMKDAQKKELATARKKMSEQQDKIRKVAQKEFDEQKLQIEKNTGDAVRAVKDQTKKLVDAAMDRAPLREQELHRKATKAYKEAKNAADQLLKKRLGEVTANIKVSDGSTVTRDIAESAVENPNESSAFTLSKQNFAAAAKFAAQKARKAKRRLDATKKKANAIMDEMKKETEEARIASEKAEALDEKVTRIKLAKLQLHEAKAASAFNKAARAHLQEELAKQQMKRHPVKDSEPLSRFQKSLKLLKEKAKATTISAFNEAKKAASALAKPVLT